MITPPPAPSSSPPWSSTTKMVIGLTVVAIVAALMVAFRNIIGPLILAFILAYVLHPVTGWLVRTLKLPWRTSVNIIYLLLVLILASLFTISGLAILGQVQSLIDIVERFITQAPDMIADLSTQVWTIGPFTLNFANLNLQEIANQAIGTLQTLIGRVGSLVSSFATSAAATLGWALFVLLISYFLLSDANRIPDEGSLVDIPGYHSDMRRLVRELRNVWNAFLRGQVIIIGLVIIAYTLLMMILGLRYAMGLALLAGLARFVPYIGPLTLSVVIALVAFFQGGNHWGMEPLPYAILVVVSAVVLDQIFDNMVTPRFLGQTLGVHPAAVLIAAIIATNLIGIVGLLLAAPVLASLTLVGRYVLRKMFDMDPWPPSMLLPKEATAVPWARGARRFQAWLRSIRREHSRR